MKFGFYCNWALLEKDNTIYMDEVNYRYLEIAAEKYEFVYLLARTKQTKGVVRGVKVNFTNVVVLKLPYFDSYLGSLFYFIEIFKGISKIVSLVDFLYVRTPEPMGWLPALLKSRGQIIHYHYTSDPMEVITNKETLGDFKKLLKKLLFWPEFKALQLASLFNSVSVNGPTILGGMPKKLSSKARVVIESTLKEGDVQPRFELETLINGDLRLLCVSRLQPGKGLFDLIESVRILVFEYNFRSFNLEIVGDGVLENDLQTYIDKLGVARFVNLVGHVSNGSELNCYYRKANVFIMPSKSETGPRVLIEAMFNGVLCISTKVGYANVVLNDGQAGVIVEPDNPKMIAMAVLSVVKDSGAANEFALAGYKRASEYTLEKFFEEIVDVK